jgi:outer membrane protein assembly factor BamD
MAALNDLIRRFPQTDYARDARLKLDLTRDHLAGKEMAIGRYYLRRGEQLAAIGRFRAVVEKYQTTSHVPEALHRLVEAYLSLGVTKEAQTAAAVLGNNYPGSDWYEDSYALMKEYGSHQGGTPVTQASVTAQPKGGAEPPPPPVEEVSAPAPKQDKTIVPPPPETNEAKPAETAEKDAEPKAEEEGGGLFDWF